MERTMHPLGVQLEVVGAALTGPGLGVAAAWSLRFGLIDQP